MTAAFRRRGRLEGFVQVASYLVLNDAEGGRRTSMSIQKLDA